MFGDIMNKIVLISLYVGSYPEYFNLWLKSAEKNEKIDFIIAGNCEIAKYEPLPKNVKAIFCTLEEVKKKFEKKLGFKIVLDKPYKLCDYKPIYSLVFEQEIFGYEYWGYIDIDTVLGNIYAFLPKEHYEKIYQFGHLTLYKNTPENNCRFMQSGGMNYKKAFSTSFNMIFDELPGMKKKYDILKVPQYLSNDFADIARRRLNFTLNSELCGKNYKYQIFYYDNGRVFRDYYKDEKICTNEYNYIHFSHRRMPDKTNGSDSFYITRFGFIPKRGKTSLDIIKKYNAPTPIQNIFCSFQTQVIRRVKRYSELVILKLTGKG